MPNANNQHSTARKIALGVSILGALSLAGGIYRANTLPSSLPQSTQEVLERVEGLESEFSRTLGDMPQFWHESFRSKVSLEELAQRFEGGAKQARELDELYASPRVIQAQDASNQMNSQITVTGLITGGGILGIIAGTLGYFMLGAYERMNEQARKDFEERHGISPN